MVFYELRLVKVNSPKSECGRSRFMDMDHMIWSMLEN